MGNAMEMFTRDTKLYILVEYEPIRYLHDEIHLSAFFLLSSFSFSLVNETSKRE